MKQNPKALNNRNSFLRPKKHLMNYRRIWRFVVFTTAGVSLIPLIFITLLDYKVTQNAIESESLSQTAKITSNTRRAISFFLEERKSALNFIINANSEETLNDPQRLVNIITNHKKSFGDGFVDLGIINSSGYQSSYIGPYKLKGKNYCGQNWYEKVIDNGSYISDVFLGYRKSPHFVIAVKKTMKDGSFFMIRAAIDIAPFEKILSNIELMGDGDAFLINQKGTLQTTSRYYGKIFNKFPLSVPQFSETSQVYEEKNIDGKELVVGYRFIDDSPFVLMIVKNKHKLIQPWFQIRLKLIAFLIGSITVILTVILWIAGYMVKRIKLSDEKRLMSVRQVEYANKMASIGRLAANVAHEINNPLAIINEKAGLVKDLFVFKDEYAHDKKLIGLVDGIIASVKRAGTITKRLLTFARKFEVAIQKINIGELLEEMLSFFQKEADYKCVSVNLNIHEKTPQIESDVSKLQQIFVNIINNAFAAISDDGYINISAGLEKNHQFDIVNPDHENNRRIYIKFEDNGCGIKKEDLHQIFEPFFSTKTNAGGTGLGLSITYNLVKEIGGELSVESNTEKGTTFKVILPLKIKSNKEV